MATRTKPADTSEPLLLDARSLARLLSIGVRTVRTHDAAGKLPQPVKLGGRTLWRRAEIMAWIDAGTPDRMAWDARRSAQK